MDLNALARSLADGVGDAHVSTDPAHCAQFAVKGAIPHLIVSPESAEQTAGVLAAANAARAVVVPWGGGTAQTHGDTLRADGRPIVILRTARLNRVLEYEPADLTITVEAGVTLAQLAALAEPNTQMLPFDVPLPARATIGGVIAAAADGPRRLGYGTVRDLFIGARVAEAGGALSKAGGRVVKNVSGFDMMKLWTGSYGTLAVLVSAAFKLLPKPRASGTIVCEFDGVAPAFGLVDALHAGPLNPTAVEVVVEPGASAVVAVWAEGVPDAVERHKRDVAHLAERLGARDARVLDGDAQTAFWSRVADLPQTAAVAGDEVVFKLAALPAQLGAALAQAHRLASDDGLSLSLSARALSGVAYARLRGPGAAGALQRMSALTPAARMTVLARGGDAGTSAWGAPPNGIDLMRRLKREFDPNDVLNPGRFVV